MRGFDRDQGINDEPNFYDILFSDKAITYEIFVLYSFCHVF